MMHICFAMSYYNPEMADRTPGQYLDRIPFIRYLPRSLADRGHEVHVVQLYPKEEHWTEGGVHFHFVPAAPGERALSEVAAWFRGRPSSGGQLAVTLASTIKKLNPDVIHFHGLLSSLNLFWMLQSLGKNGPPTIGHYHGGNPSENRVVRRLQTHNLRRLAFTLFTTQEHADPFVESQMLRQDQVVELMEVSTAFRRQPQEKAQESTGMQGWPVFIWAGRLHPVKEPLVALRGFEIIAEHWPDAQLYLYYLTGELLQEMKAYVMARPSLAERIHFRGRAPHEKMEAIYSSADFLLQSSKREFSGYAVLEAMACGVIPVVTDIPSFRAMTEDGRFGILFPVGDHRELARRVLAFDLGSLVRKSEEVQAHFDEALSFRAMAERLEGIYLAALNRESSKQKAV